jgi:hypothetical protein
MFGPGGAMTPAWQWYLYQLFVTAAQSGDTAALEAFDPGGGDAAMGLAREVGKIWAISDAGPALAAQLDALGKELVMARDSAGVAACLKGSESLMWALSEARAPRTVYVGTHALRLVTPATGGAIFFETDTKLLLVASAGNWVAIAVTGAPPSGAAAGDLTGTYPNPGVARINGTAFAGAVGNLVSFGVADTPADSGIAESAVVTAPGAWTAFTTTITPSSGTWTPTSQSCAYLQIGKLVFVRLNVVGSLSVATAINITLALPVAPVIDQQILAAMQVGAPGYSAVAANGGASLYMYPGGGGNWPIGPITLRATGIYEAA